MTNNVSLSSEKIISEILRAIARLEMPVTITVQQDAIVKGRMNEHQADIYWEFTDSEITYKTLIRTKDWQKEATTADLFSFWAELRDIPGQTTGVLFTQPIYQKDVRKLANDAGIVLYEVRMPQDEVLWQPVVYNPRINVDLEWAAREKERLGKTDETIQIGGNPRYMYIYDEQGNCIDTVQGIIDSYTRKRFTSAQDRQLITHEFTTPTFLQTDNDLFPKVKLDSVSFELEFITPNAVQGEELVEYIVDGVMTFFGR